MSIFKACDIRGVVGSEWDNAEALQIGQALGQRMRQEGETEICVGGDFRRSTLGLKEALIRGLVQAGIDVRDVALQPTPVVYFAARHWSCPNMATVTASHNPGQYNGIKFQVAGVPPDPEMIRQLEKGMDAPPPSVPPGSVTSLDALADYEQWIVRESQTMARRARATGLRATGVSPVLPSANRHERKDSQHAKRDEMATSEGQQRQLRVVVDSMGGAFTHIAPRVLTTARYAVTSLWSEFDRDFSGRSPNPSSDDNLTPLIEAVIGQSADAGVAFDGDGDRAVLVDHTGKIVRPEQLAVLFLQTYFDRPTVVYDLKCASILAQAAERAGGRAVMRPSGYGFIKAEMIRQRAEMGVEASGHHFFGALGGGDDGLFTALAGLGIVRRTGTSLAELIAPVGWPAITPDLRVDFTGDAVSAVQAIAVDCGGSVSQLDGVRARYDDGWALARASITEPAITFRFEGRSPEDLPRIASRFLAGQSELLRLVMEKMNE